MVAKENCVQNLVFLRVDTVRKIESYGAKVAKRPKTEFCVREYETNWSREWAPSAISTLPQAILDLSDCPRRARTAILEPEMTRFLTFFIPLERSKRKTSDVHKTIAPVGRNTHQSFRATNPKRQKIDP